MVVVKDKRGKTVKVSVIIVTLNRERFLEETVKTLLSQQSYDDYEIVIVDQSDAVSRCDFADMPGGDRVRYHHIEEKSITNARNIGISLARGEVLLFLDDDIKPSKDLIYHHARHYGDPKIGGVAGRVVEEVPVKNTSFPGVRVALSGRALINCELSRKQLVYASFGANMSFSREAVQAAGKFDKRFTGLALLEETDYCYRVRKCGYALLAVPEAELFHLRAGSGGCRHKDYRSLLMSRFRNTVLFCCKHHNKCVLPYVFLIHFIIAIKKVLEGKLCPKDFFRVLGSLAQGLEAYREPIEESKECSRR